MTNLSILGIGEPGWKCDVGKPINNCKDGWVKPNFDDGKRKELQLYEKFGGSIWGFGAAKMREILKDPDSKAYWVWAGPNDVKDDIYLRFTIKIGTDTSVKPAGKLATTWGNSRPDVDWTSDLTMDTLYVFLVSMPSNGKTALLDKFSGQIKVWRLKFIRTNTKSCMASHFTCKHDRFGSSILGLMYLKAMCLMECWV